MTQNARQLPLVSKDAYGTTSYIDITTGFDANGNVASSVDAASPGHSRTMTYDDLDRLAGVTNNQHWNSATYTYDLLDNLRTSQLVKASGTDTLTYAYDAFNRVGSIARTGMPTWTYGHDSRGNVNADGRRQYTWTRANRLAEVKDASGLLQESYQYDGHGRRVLISRANNGTAAVPVYGLDGALRMTADNAKGGTTTHVYLGDDKVADVFFRWSDGALTPTYLHTDALGSPILRTNASRSIVSRSVYAPYGQVVDDPATSLDNEVDGIGYTGHAYDAATDLVYMQQRYYDPVVGRFISTDSMAVDKDTAWNFNRYNYADGSPYVFADPDGRAACPADEAGCIDSPSTESGAERQLGPTEGQRAIDRQVRRASRSDRLSDGTALQYAGEDEYGFAASESGTRTEELTESKCYICDGARVDKRGFTPANLSEGESGGHSHYDGLDIVGPEDGKLAAATGRTAYVISRRGAFAVDKTKVGFRVRQLDGAPLNNAEKMQVRERIDGWNQNNGGSGAACTRC